MSIGERLVEARKSKGFSQPDLVRKSGVAERTIRDIESGVTQNPSTATVKRLAATLGIPAEQLMGDEPVERPAPKARQAPAGPKSAREALADETHYLRYLFRRAGLVTDEEQAKAAAAFDERFKQFDSTTAALVDLWIDGYVRDLSERSTTSRKRGRGV